MRVKLGDQSAVGILDSLIARLVLENQLARIVDPASRVTLPEWRGHR